jgi:hypothetical protein
VAQAFSGFRLRFGTTEGIAGYHGRFEADAKSLDVLTLEVIADNEIPPEVAIKEATTKMRYHRMPIGQSDFLLPESSEMTIVDLLGHESRNVVTLSGCKQYGTESVISFAEPPPSESAPAPPPPPSATSTVGELPMGLTFEAELTTSLSFPGAAIGDLVEGRVTSDAKRKGAVMIPKGAAIRARLIDYGPVDKARVPTLGMKIELEEIDLPGGRAAVHGVAERVLPVGANGARLTVDNSGNIFIVGGTRRQLSRGSRIYWRLEQKSEKR